MQRVRPNSPDKSVNRRNLAVSQLAIANLPKDRSSPRDVSINLGRPPGRKILNANVFNRKIPQNMAKAGVEVADVKEVAGKHGAL